MDRSPAADPLAGVEVCSPVVREILAHLCRGDCHAYGTVAELCETRGDCVFTVLCPGCAKQFVIDDDELAELRRWTDAEGHALVCGIREE